MPAHITLIRHAETEANAAGLWQGGTDTRFSRRGEEQVARLIKRFSGSDPHVVVSSDLGRAAATAGALGHDVTHDARWREPNVGEWEGLGFEEIRSRWPDQLHRLMEGEDVTLGGGERLSDVAVRLREAFDELVTQLGDDGSAIVVSHGLALLTLTSDLLGTKRPAPLRLMGNTGATTFAATAHGPQLIAYNNVDHLPSDGRRNSDETDVVLIRHGETDANVEGRWQGHGDWPLNEAGRRQADRLAGAPPELDVLYASPLGRARATAASVAAAQGHSLEIDDRLKEIGFGKWENLTREEVEAADPELIARLAGGEDIRRGGTGETLCDVQDRMGGVIEAIAARHPGVAAGVVSHGGATRAYLMRLLGMDFAARHRIRTLRNTAYGRVTFGRRGPALVHWNSAPHLDEGDGEASWLASRS